MFYPPPPNELVNSRAGETETVIRLKSENNVLREIMRELLDAVKSSVNTKEYDYANTSR